MTQTIEHNFRQDARNALNRARAEFESGEDARIKYGILELRFALEALTYDRAQIYQEELPEETYETWQPAKLMKELLKIDPHGDQSVTLQVNIGENQSDVAKEFTTLGSEIIVSLAKISKYYHALGNYLHYPTIKQLKNQDGQNLNKIRSKIDEIFRILEDCLKSSMINCKLTIWAAARYCLRCDNRLVRRLKDKNERCEVECICGARYFVSYHKSGLYCWETDKQLLKCPNNGCEGRKKIWPDEYKKVFSWKCDECAEEFEVCNLAVKKADLDAARAKKIDQSCWPSE